MEASEEGETGAMGVRKEGEGWERPGIDLVTPRPVPARAIQVDSPADRNNSRRRACQVRSGQVRSGQTGPVQLPVCT